MHIPWNALVGLLVAELPTEAFYVAIVLLRLTDRNSRVPRLSEPTFL